MNSNILDTDAEAIYDGITELENQQGEAYSEDRLYALLKSLHKESIQTIIKEIEEALRSCSNNFEDEIRVVLNR